MSLSHFSFFCYTNMLERFPRPAQWVIRANASDTADVVGGGVSFTFCRRWRCMRCNIRAMQYTCTCTISAQCASIRDVLSFRRYAKNFEIFLQTANREHTGTYAFRNDPRLWDCICVDLRRQSNIGHAFVQILRFGHQQNHPQSISRTLRLNFHEFFYHTFSYGLQLRFVKNFYFNCSARIEFGDLSAFYFIRRSSPWILSPSS